LKINLRFSLLDFPIVKSFDRSEAKGKRIESPVRKMLVSNRLAIIKDIPLKEHFSTGFLPAF
jgi:hypothetical protein